MSGAVIQGEGLEEAVSARGDRSRMNSSLHSWDSAKRIPELDGLRGLAILLVFLSHYLGGSEHQVHPDWLRRIISATNIGWSGVDLFFVLSGFLIGGILLDERRSSSYFRTFYLRRMHRILPIYYLWILLFAAIVSAALLGAPFPYHVNRHDLLQIPLQLAFLQNMQFDRAPFIFIWFLVTWSLAVEEQFYLLAPPLVRLLSLRHLIYVLFAAVVVAPFVRLYLFEHMPTGSLAPAFVLPGRADTLACGILLAIGWRQEAFHKFLARQRGLLQGAVLFLLLGVILMLPRLVGDITLLRATLGFSWFAALYSCLVLLVLSQSGGWLAAVMRWKPLRSLGAISYCVYIIHLTILILAHQLILHAGPQIRTLSGIAVTCFAAVSAVAVASISWRYFEKPLITRGHTYSYVERPAV
ncbi:MAG TPA: acyltransferase [Candidatus Acidoferrum sp.]|nr:acyltransferase [Candidatus Acidoferrum sp.]